MKHSIPQRLLSALLLLALAVSLFATAALAEPVAVAAADVVAKNGSDGSITVTVYDTNPGTPGTGVQWTPDTGVQGVEGVGINALRIGDVVELTTTVGGKVQTQVAFGFTSGVCALLGLSTNNAIASLDSTTYYFTPSAATAALGTANQATIEEHLDDDNATLKDVTEADGIASFTGLTYGVYLLAKSALPADATTDLSPFLVSVPMYVEADEDWNNNVYAYPKVRTGTLAITKTAKVGDNDTPVYVNAGETIEYTISVPIPATGLGAGGMQNFTAFTVTDTNKGSTLDITDGTDGVTVSLVNDSASTTNKLDPADYTVTYPGDGTDSVLTVTLKASGLQKLNAGLTRAQTFTITYSATAATDVDFSTGLTNTAALSYDRGLGPLTSSDSVTLYTYGIDLTKTLSDSGTITAGAITFALYTDENCTAKIPMTPGTGPNGGYWRAASENNPATVMSVGTGDKLKIYGLAPGTYYLKELTTMEHYTLLAAPIEIVITGAATPDAPDAITATVNGKAVTPQDGLVPLTVENTRNTNGFNLPQTGGAGTLAAIAIGLGLLSCAVILLVIYRKKENR